jgi:hypothetical protein
VVYKYLSSDTTLASLEVSEGFLEPDFDPLVSAYVDTLPHGVKIIPAVLVVASDTSARVMVDEAQYPESPWEIFRTTTITVTSANGLYTGKYSILFTMDLTQPEVILVHDSVEADGELGMILTEADHAYLVPENTPGVFDSIIAAQLAEMEAGIADTAYLSTSGVEPGTYWIYACDRHQSVSESQEVTIFEKEITSVNDLSAEKIKVYPSPVSQTLYVVSPHPLEQIELYNVIGVPVLKVKNPDGSIDVGNLPEGVYVLRLIMEQNKSFTIRIIKK